MSSCNVMNMIRTLAGSQDMNTQPSGYWHKCPLGKQCPSYFGGQFFSLEILYCSVRTSFAGYHLRPARRHEEGLLCVLYSPPCQWRGLWPNDHINEDRTYLPGLEEREVGSFRREGLAALRT